MLTDAKARKSKRDDKPTAVGGVPGLYFKPSAKAGSGKFVLRFVSPTTGKRRDMGLGSYPALSIAQARKMAIEARERIQCGADPIDERQRAAFEADRLRATPTFEQAARQVYADIAPGFRNKKHSAQWITTLESYAFPSIGQTQVDQLTTADFARVLKPIWLTKAETASRVRQRCERVMTWCVAHGYAATNAVNAATALLPKQPGKRDRVKHFPSVPWRQLPEVVEQLFSNTRQRTGRQALLFLILTGARSGEVRGAAWQEFDFANQIWTIPAQRMKAGVQHRVPLSTQAIVVLQQRLEFANPLNLAFSNSGKAPISDMTLTKILRDHDIPSDVAGRTATAHGFRSSFRDWASEHQYPRDLAERALAHTIANTTEAAYHRTDLLEQRRQMMQAWADHVVSRIVSK